jgi:hypothetical protein
MADRVAIARGLLRMAAGAGADRDAAIAKRLEGWEAGGALTLPEVGMVTILQVLRGWSDSDLVAAALDGDAGGRREIAEAAFQRANAMRTWTNDCYRLVLLLMGSRPMDPEGAAGLPPDVADVYEDVVQQGGGAPADLDDAMEAVLAGAGIELPADGGDGHRISALDPSGGSRW